MGKALKLRVRVSSQCVSVEIVQCFLFLYKHKTHSVADNQSTTKSDLKSYKFLTCYVTNKKDNILVKYIRPKKLIICFSGTARVNFNPHIKNFIAYQLINVEKIVDTE